MICLCGHRTTDHDLGWCPYCSINAQCDWGKEEDE